MIRVVVAGAGGRVGRAMTAELPAQPGIAVVGGFGRDGPDRETLLEQADVLVDFTTAEAAPALHLEAIGRGVRVVSGTTGLTPEALDRLHAVAEERGIGAVWASNFAIGAVLMMHFARVAARYMDAAEIVEMHHDGKADAPSGTALTTARGIREARGTDLPDPPVKKTVLEGTRGGVVGGVRVHSIRLPGLLAHQEVMFGAAGQILTLRHDALGRETYVPGVALAIREVMNRVGLVRGLDTLLGLSG